eukprot:5564748-Amphidinium_carterae.1
MESGPCDGNQRLVLTLGMAPAAIWSAFRSGTPREEALEMHIWKHGAYAFNHFAWKVARRITAMLQEERIHYDRCLGQCKNC